MPVAWRVVKKKYAASAFDGEGAFRFGGRWNSPGTRVVYASESIALALLEMVVHTSGPMMRHYVAIPVEFPEALVTTLDVAGLPKGWQAHPGPFGLRRLGDAWVEGGESAVLRVPSAVVPVEHNYVLSPEHPKFKKIKIGEALELPLDLRLLRT